MAKHKETASAAIRRLETAMAHIDRLTDELVDAKMRARQHEAATRRVSTLETEVARLRDQVATGSSDALDAMTVSRDWHAARAEEAIAYADDIRRKWEKVTTRFVEAFTAGTFDKMSGLNVLVNLLDDQPEWWDVKAENRVNGHGSKLRGLSPSAQKALVRVRSAADDPVKWGRKWGA